MAGKKKFGQDLFGGYGTRQKQIDAITSGKPRVKKTGGTKPKRKGGAGGAAAVGAGAKGAVTKRALKKVKRRK